MTTVKESSDELNPAVAIPETEIAPRGRRKAADYLALAIATCGVGYFPIAPGTLGSLVGAAVYLSIWEWVFELLQVGTSQRQLSLLYISTLLSASMLLLIVLITIMGIWAASR